MLSTAIKKVNRALTHY